MRAIHTHGRFLKGRGHPCPRVPGREALETRGQGCPRPFREVHELALLQSSRDHFLIALLIASLGSAFAVFAESFELPSKESPEATWWWDSMKTRDERIE